MSPGTAAAMAKRKPKRSPSPGRREEILSRAQAIFFREGNARMSMDALAGALGISKRTLYECFPSRAGIIRAFLEAQLESFNGTLVALGEEDRPFAERLQVLFDSILTFFSRIPPAFLLDLRRREPAIFSELMARRNALVLEHFSRFLGEGRAKGSIRAELRTDFLVAFFVHSLPNILQPELFDSLNLGGRDVVAQLQILLKGGLLAPEGARLAKGGPRSRGGARTSH